jgi:hypothetical protein
VYYASNGYRLGTLTPQGRGWIAEHHSGNEVGFSESMESAATSLASFDDSLKG